MSNLNEYDVELDEHTLARIKATNLALAPCALNCGRLLEIRDSRKPQYCYECQGKIGGIGRYTNKHKGSLTDEEKAKIRGNSK